MNTKFYHIKKLKEISSFSVNKQKIHKAYDSYYFLSSLQSRK